MNGFKDENIRKRTTGIAIHVKTFMDRIFRLTQSYLHIIYCQFKLHPVVSTRYYKIFI